MIKYPDQQCEKNPLSVHEILVGQERESQLVDYDSPQDIGQHSRGKYHQPTGVLTAAQICAWIKTCIRFIVNFYPSHSF